jgi:succinate dehydrogenase hydrophobic anchor subunit
MTARSTDATPEPVRLGLRENLWQFTLLVVVNAFVGAMVGLERSILPAMAEQEFHLAARAAVLSFIVVFGIASLDVQPPTTGYRSARTVCPWQKHSSS